MGDGDSEEAQTAEPEASARVSARAARAGARSGARAGNDTSAGLPIFCRQRHFLRSANVYVVPLWDLTSRWMPEELKSYAASAPSRASFEPPSRAQKKVVEESEGREEDVEDLPSTATGGDEDLPSDSEHSEIGWDGPLGGDNRVWCRAQVDNAQILLRRMQAVGEAPGYGIGVSSAMFAPGSMAEDTSMDKRLAQVLRTREPCWAVCALRSGHFAGAVFKGQEPVIHKAIHRYTVRAKAGGAQSACDSGKKVKSVGSSLRRYGETRLAEEIKELMTDKWAPELAECELILVSVSKRMKSTLLGTEKEPFLPDNSKVRKLPFMVGKPTFEAVRDAYLRVASVIFTEDATAETLAAKFRPAQPAAPTIVAAPPEPVQKASKPPAEEPKEKAKPYREEEDELFTAFHAAAFADDEAAIIHLLDGGADPRLRDGKGRVPYYLCTTQRAREAFRKWRGSNEDAWDWTAAQVPEGINEETEERKREKEKEKKKKQKEKQKAAKAKQKEEEEERIQKEEEEKRMLEAAQAKCDFCGKPLLSKPFTRLSYLYCSADCVNKHRRELQAEAAMKRLGG